MQMIRIKGRKRVRDSESADCASSEGDDDSSDEPQEVQEAALSLCKVSRAKVDDNTLAKLWKSLNRTYASVGKMASEQNSTDNQEERVTFTCSEGLELLMGKRGKQFKKILTRSDLDDAQARLNMRKESVVNHVLPLLREGENIEEGISVTTYNSDGVGFPMVFKVWCCKSNVLTRGWTKFAHANGLRRRLDESITIQAFRHADTDELSFLILLAGNGLTKNS